MEMTIETREDRLHVTAWGPVVPGDFKAAFVRIFVACAENRVSRALIDCRTVEAEFSTLDRFEFGAVLAKVHADHAAAAGPVRLAFVGREPVVEPGRLGETVAVNRGVIVRVTTDHDEALRFLAIDDGG